MYSLHRNKLLVYGIMADIHNISIWAKRSISLFIVPSPFFVHCLKLQLHDAIYRLRFYSNSLIHILSLSNSHNNVVSIQKNRGDKSHRVIVALASSLGFTFDDFSCVVDVALERVWVKKPGEENNIKSKA